METLKYYQTGKDLCQRVYKYIKEQTETETDIEKLLTNGTSKLRDLLGSKGQVFIPVCTSVNNCIGMYHGSGTLQEGDVVKVEMAVCIKDCITHFGETFLYKSTNEDHKRILKKLKDIPKNLCKKVMAEETSDGEIRLVNDDVTNFITAECTKFDCYPLENVVSYKGNLEGYLSGEDRITLGFKKQEDEEYVLFDNPCYDLEDNDVFNINVTIAPEYESQYTYKGKIYNENEFVYSELEEPHLYRFTGEKKMYRLQSVREFINTVGKKYGYCAFTKTDSPKNKLGLKYTLQDGVTVGYPVRYVKQIDTIIPVFCKIFTVYTRDGKLLIV